MKKCVIIGAGPGGMSAAIYLKRAGIEPIIVEKEVAGGEMLKTSTIENYLGFENIDGATLAINMKKQLQNLGINIIKDEVIKVSKDNEFIVTLKKDVIRCDNVIVATGRVPNKLKGIDKGISYCAVCDGAFYRGLDVAVVGGGDSALTEALYLSKMCNKVYILVRNEVRASEILKNRVKSNENIIILKNTEVKSLIFDDKLTGVILNNDKELNVSGLFVAIGGKPNIEFLDFDVKNINGYLVTDDKMETSVKGLYAAGDVRKKDFYQIITAVSDGAIAALSIGSEVND